MRVRHKKRQPQCYNCEKKGHLSKDCPAKGKSKAKTMSSTKGSDSGIDSVSLGPTKAAVAVEEVSRSPAF